MTYLIFMNMREYFYFIKQKYNYRNIVMKKNYPIYLILFALLLSACSEDENWTDKRAAEITKIYRDTELKLNLNGYPLKSRSVKFQTTDLKNADITFPYLIPGEDEIIITNAEISVLDGNPNLFGFTGTNKNADRELVAEGKVGDGLELNLTYKGTSQAVNHWKLASTSSITFKITPSSPDAKANMFGIMFAREVPVSNGTISGFDRRLGSILGIVMNLLLTLDIDLQENGDFIAGWAPKTLVQFEAGNSPQGLLRYNVMNERLYLAADVAEILPNLLTANLTEGLPDDIDLEAILPLVKQLYHGLPLDLSVNDRLSLNLTKETFLPYYQLLCPFLETFLAEADLPSGLPFGINNTSLSSLIVEIKRVMEESPEFTITLSFQPIPSN